MPRKPPPPEEPASPKAKPKRPRKPRATAGPAARVEAKRGDIPPILPEDRALMGESIAPTVERDGSLLLALARKSFPALTPPEERFFRNLGIVDFGDDLPDEKDDSKTLRADRLAWALMDRRALRLLTPKGVEVFGANIIGQLNLILCQAGLRLQLDICRLDKMPQLQHARLSLLSLQGSCCPGLYADGMQVQGGVFLREKAVFQGDVRLLGAEIGGNFECDGSTFTNKRGNALSADGITVKGSVFLRGKAVFQGEVRLLGAEISGDLTCAGSTFANKGGYALSANRTTVKGDVFLHSACACKGMADFTGAEIGGAFRLYGLKQQKELSLRLSHARVGVLWDAKESWPEPGRLWLDGFQYGRLAEQAEWGLKARLDWLERHQNAGDFNPQPYEQLAKVYKEAGHEAEAREVLIAKNRRRLAERRKCLPRLGKLAESWPGRPRSLRAVLPWLLTTLPVWLGRAWGPCRSVAAYWLIWFFGKICAFGYKPWRAAGWWFGLWFVTWPLASLMAAGGWLVPTMVDQQAGTVVPIGFTSSGFSFDLLTPIFDMGYLSAWTPANNLAALLLLGLGTFGYILVALFAASITGLIRK